MSTSLTLTTVSVSFNLRGARDELCPGCRVGNDRHALSASRRAREVLRDEPDGHAAVADGGGDHLRRPRADIARGEDAGPARLEQEGLSAELLPGFAIVRAARQLGTRENEAVIVEGYFAGEPRGARFRSDEDDHAAGVERSTRSGTHMLHGDPLHVPLTADLANLVAEQHLDPTFLRNAGAQVARHRALEAVCANHEIDVPLVLGEGERRLSSRVRTPDDYRRIAETELLSGRVCCVAHAEPLVVGDARNRPAACTGHRGRG